MARILQAKYFVDGNYLNSSCGASPSMVWRSIWQAKEIFLRGCRVRIGTGVDVNVWNAPWLPD